MRDLRVAFPNQTMIVKQADKGLGRHSVSGRQTQERQLLDEVLLDGFRLSDGVNVGRRS